jgi:hypothetical protein
MSKVESFAVGAVVGFLCPLLLFVAAWWTTAVLAVSRLFAVPVSAVPIAALAGLGLGIVLDAVFMRGWVARFYDVGPWVTVPVYVACSVIATAFGMGLPLGNLALGTLAGVYVGRSARHVGLGAESFARAARRVGRFVALVTGLEALPIGVLALGEDWLVDLLGSIAGLDERVIVGPAGVGAIVVLCVLLAAIQFWSARASSRLAYHHS